ncbi:sulfurtransferase complex subunit TusB [Vreelandella malpeensis]|uniref:Sulfurtransferase complex subunit TusB n=1 Tax=Vreelandella malpeensis TaxID=1172368 RepID=A0ABS8DU84_9GAMM|nr:sulfurtransferase complex subunit TusB [Halomonas malpeensis]MCB8889823.1 sulfurtransferase complex subunit TusB [Halomonas malpeensis]
MLHILNKAPASDRADDMLAVVSETDEVVLIEQAVQACLVPHWPGFERCRGRLYLLEEDLASRGLLEMARRGAFSTIDVEGFVALSERHTRSVTWY